MYASLRAMAAPMPRPAPVTTATCFVNGFTESLTYHLCARDLSSAEPSGTPESCILTRKEARDCLAACHIAERVLIIRSPEEHLGGHPSTGEALGKFRSLRHGRVYACVRLWRAAWMPGWKTSLISRELKE